MLNNLFNYAANETAAKLNHERSMMMDSFIVEKDEKISERKSYVKYLKLKGLESLYGKVTYGDLIKRLSKAEEIAEEVVARARHLGMTVKMSGEEEGLRQYVIDGVSLYDTRSSSLMEDEEYNSLWNKWINSTIPSMKRIKQLAQVYALELKEGMPVEQSMAMYAMENTTGQINDLLNKALDLARKDPKYCFAEFEEARLNAYNSLLSTKESEEYAEAIANFTEDDRILYEIGRLVESFARRMGVEELDLTSNGAGYPIVPNEMEIYSTMRNLKVNDFSKLNVLYKYYKYGKLSYENYAALSGVNITPEEARAGRVKVVDFFLRNKMVQEAIEKKDNSCVIPKQLSLGDTSMLIPLVHHYQGASIEVNAPSIEAYIELSKLDNLNTLNWVKTLSGYKTSGITTCNKKSYARLRSDWNEVTNGRLTTEETKLLEAMRKKFDTSHGGLKRLENLLVNTGDKTLYSMVSNYAENKLDSHLGVDLNENGNIIGENTYGELLMRVRSEILKRREGGKLYSPSFLKKRRAVMSEEEIAAEALKMILSEL